MYGEAATNGGAFMRGAGLRQWHIAEFIDDQQLVASKLALQTQEPFVVAGFNQFMHESGGGREANRDPFLASGQTETQRDVALAGAGVADRDDVLASLDVF